MQLLVYVGGDIALYTSDLVNGSRVIESNVLGDEYVRSLYAMSKTGQMQQKPSMPQGR